MYVHPGLRADVSWGASIYEGTEQKKESDFKNADLAPRLVRTVEGMPCLIRQEDLAFGRLTAMA